MSEPLDSPEPASRSVSLVPTEADPATPGPRSHARPLAGFITQLLACECRLPAYRARRQADPEEATDRYGAGGGTVRPRARFERVL